MQRFFGFNSVREGPATRSIRLAVPVVVPRDSRHQTDAAEVDLVRARVVADVVRIAGAVGEHRQPRVAGTECMRDARRSRPRDHTSWTNGMLLVAEDAEAVAFEDHEELLLDRVALRGRAQLSGCDPVV